MEEKKGRLRKGGKKADGRSRKGVRQEEKEEKGRQMEGV